MNDGASLEALENLLLLFVLADKIDSPTPKIILLFFIIAGVATLDRSQPFEILPTDTLNISTNSQPRQILTGLLSSMGVRRNDLRVSAASDTGRTWSQRNRVTDSASRANPAPGIGRGSNALTIHDCFLESAARRRSKVYAKRIFLLPGLNNVHNKGITRSSSHPATGHPPR